MRPEFFYALDYTKQSITLCVDNSMKLIQLLLYFISFCSIPHSLPDLDPDLEIASAANGDKEVTLILKFLSPETNAIAPGSVKSVQMRKMEKARAAQGNFLKDIQSLNPMERVEITSLWINNTIILKTRMSMVEKLAKREDLESIIADKTLYLEEPQEGGSRETDVDSKFTYGLIKLGIPEVRRLYKLTGKGVTVGLLDSGYADHPDISGRVILARDFVSEKPPNLPNDGHGHGTHCLGTIGGRDHSGKSIGVAPDVKFIVGKIFRDNASTEISKQLEAMQWIADPDGDPDTQDQPRIVSNSWGWKLKKLSDPGLYQDAVKTWREMGIVPVFSAGNSGPYSGTIGVPGGFVESNAIGATDSSDQVASFSSRGIMKWQGVSYLKPNVSAPGVNVYSAKHTGGYVEMSGTSMAAPHVAGVFALMVQAFPELSVAGLEEILSSTALDLGEEGPDFSFGYGRVNALAAVEEVFQRGRLLVEMNGGEYDLKVMIQPGDKIYSLRPGHALDLALKGGEYDLQIHTFGYETYQKKLKIKERSTTSLSVDLVPKPHSSLTIEMKSEGLRTQDAWIVFHDSELGVARTTNGVFNASIPNGKYRVSVTASGFAREDIEIDLASDLRHFVQLDSGPSFLLVVDDSQEKYQEFYRSSLEQLDISHRVSSTGQSVDLADLLSHGTVIWYTGDDEEDTLNILNREHLKQFLSLGGKLLLTGQGIGNDLNDTGFYHSVLGAEFRSQRYMFKKIQFQDQKFRLNGGDSANNQKAPDVIKAVLDSSKDVIRYSYMGVAGVLNSYENGRVLYLGFGLEGIRDAARRRQFLNDLLALLEPSIAKRMERISKAYYESSNLHSKLMGDLSWVNSGNKNSILELLSSISDKSPYRKLLYHLRNE
jgi:hypothetical protein